MPPWSKELGDKIIAALAERGVNKSCARCGNRQYSLEQGYILLPLGQTSDTNPAMAGTVIPSVAVICSQCGNINLHALGTLGFPIRGEGPGPGSQASINADPEGGKNTPGESANE